MYIKYGWNRYLVGPDKDVTNQGKLDETQGSHFICLKLLHSIPDAEDQWTNWLYDLPKITFRTIYCHLVHGSENHVP